MLFWLLTLFDFLLLLFNNNTQLAIPALIIDDIDFDYLTGIQTFFRLKRFAQSSTNSKQTSDLFYTEKKQK